LPSGAVFEIKQIDIPTLNELQKVFGKMPTTQLSSENIAEYLPELTKILLPNGVAQPEVTIEPTENSLGINEINIGDQITLIFEIMDFSGIGEAGQRLRRSFRRRTTRKASS